MLLALMAAQRLPVHLTGILCARGLSDLNAVTTLLNAYADLDTVRAWLDTLPRPPGFVDLNRPKAPT